MHIAVCDDNIADRKQLERLLKRESDKRKTDTGILYSDSFGNSNAVTKVPMQYDLFFIDMAESGTDALSFALSLIESGVTAPIVLCSSKINYLEKMNTLSPCPANLLHLKKPIGTMELSKIIDTALLLNKQKVPTIELRSETNTCYVYEDDIVCAKSKGRYVHVRLKDGTCIPIMTTILNFYEQISMYRHILLLNDQTLFNITYLEKYTPFRVLLSDGTILKSSPFSFHIIKNALQMYR